MIDKIVGEVMKLLSFRYNEEKLHFEVECILPGQKVIGIHTFNKQNFPKHTPFTVLDEKLQVGEIVHVWLKDEKDLISEGWKNNTKHTMSSTLSPFKIGKNKKPYLGSMHKGVVCIDAKFRPFIKIKDFRFSPNELKCILRADVLIQGKTSRLESNAGTYTYDAETGVVRCPEGFNMGRDTVNNLIDLLRRAKVV